MFICLSDLLIINNISLLLPSLVVALQDGGVNSYLVDEAEEYREADFISYLKTNWNMVIAMSMVIGAFVLNEYHNHA